jgi:hypothetical protein
MEYLDKYLSGISKFISNARILRSLVVLIFMVSLCFGSGSPAYARGIKLESGSIYQSNIIVPVYSPVPPAANPGNENWSSGSWVQGVDNSVTALLVDGSGNLYAGGTFITVGGVTANQVARWDGSTWSPLCNGSNCGMNGAVNAFAFDSAGNLYAGGDFTTAGGVAVNYIARWDGTRWSALCSGGSCGMNKAVNALAVDSTGILYAGGLFASAGSTSARYISKWDGTTWTALCDGGNCGMNNKVNALVVDSADDLYAAGTFSRAGGKNVYRVAKWDGTSWSALCNDTNCGMDPAVNALVLDSAGRLYAGGPFSSAGGLTVNHLAVWDGINWSGLCSGNSCGSDGVVNALEFDSAGNLYAGGSFTLAGGMAVNNIAKWNGRDWTNLGSGVDNTVHAMEFDFSGRLHTGGAFSTAGGVVSPYIAEWTAAVGIGGLQAGLSYDFYTGNLPVVMDINALGGLDSISIQRFNKDHPGASLALQTGYYWSILGTDSSGTLASGYNVDLTLPTAFTADASDADCRFLPAVSDWDCGVSSFTTQSVTRRGVTQCSEWAVGRGIVPQTPVLTINRSQADIVLSWQHSSTGVDHYEVWRATNRPYFTPADPGATKLSDIPPDLSQSYVYTDTSSALGDTLNNSYYRLRAVYISGLTTDSDPVGEYDFPIQRGGLGSYAWTSIALPLEVGSISADGIAAYIDPSGSIKRVGKWDANTKTWIFRIVGSPFPPSNFPVNVGEALLIYAQSTAPASFAWVGDVPDAGYISYSLALNQWKFLMVPLDQDPVVITTADQLAADIQFGGSSLGMRIGKWNLATQTWIYRVVGSPFPPGNYPIVLGYPYFVLTNGLTPPQWP